MWFVGFFIPDEHALPGEGTSKLFCARQKVFGGRQLVEDMFQRLLAGLFHELCDCAIGDNRSLMNDDDSLADAFDDIEDVLAVDDRFALVGQGSN